MGRKKTLKLPSSPFKTNKELAPPRIKHHHHNTPWCFLLCAQQNKTLSFESKIEIENFTTKSDHSCSLEKLVHGVVRSSERLFFEPLSTSCSILENYKSKVDVGGVQKPFKGLTNNWVEPPGVSLINFKENVLLLGVESEDPYGDFRRSMEEVVETFGVKDWKDFEELLGWYLRLNGKNNHGFIVLAFVDLLVTLAAEAASSSSNDSCSHSFTSYCSALSSFASSPLCLLDQSEVIGNQDERS